MKSILVPMEATDNMAATLQSALKMAWGNITAKSAAKTRTAKRS